MLENPRILRFRTAAPQDVVDTWQRFVPTSELLHVDQRSCKLNWFSIESEGFSLVRYEMGADVRSAIAPEDQLFTCHVATSTGGVTHSGRDIDASRPWATTGAPVEARWQGSATVHAIAFPRAKADELARQISGDDSFTVALRSPAASSAASAAQWHRTWNYLASSLAVPQTHPSSLLEAGLQRHAIWTLLTTFHTNFVDGLERTAQSIAAPRTVRRAMAHIDAHAHESITVDDVASAVHISTRGLQYAFKRSLGITPNAYLRSARISGAHEELLAADESVSIADIARRWGFLNPARFAAHYREQYGRHPREVRERLR